MPAFPMPDDDAKAIVAYLRSLEGAKDEAPFTGKQVRALENQLGWRTESVYCGVLEMPASLLTSKLMRSRPENFILRWADKVESWLHRRRWLLAWNQYIVFNLVKA